MSATPPRPVPAVSASVPSTENSRPLFPLRVSSIERLHDFDNHAAWPNRIGTVLNCRGTINEEWARKALFAALARHPLMFARLDPRKSRWHLPVADCDRFCFATGPCPTGNRGETESAWRDMPDDSDGGVIAMARSCGEETQITFLIDHARADGLGGLQVVREWMQIYDNISGGKGELHGLPELDPQRLRRRNHLGLCTPRYFRNLWRQPIALFGTWKFLFRRFARLGNDSRSERGSIPPPAEAGLPKLLACEIGPQQLRQIRASCHRINVSLNDWMVGSLFEAVEQWRQEHGCSDNRPWIRMIIPISLREKSDVSMPAANRSTLVQLDRCAADFSPRVRLMQGVCYELGLIRAWQLDRMLLVAVRIIGTSRAWLRASTDWRQHRATTLLTNLAKPFLKSGLARDPDGRLRFGGLSLESADLVAPLKHGMAASFAVHQYRQRMRISMQYDPHILDRERADSLLRMFAERAQNDLV